MAQLHRKIEAYVGRDVDFIQEVKVEDDMVGGVSNPYIREWNIAEKAEPTEEQLNALDAEATTAYNNSQVINTRKNLYGTPEQQIENIIENGLDAEISRVNQIKSENPKT